jgi:hypothetical protein
MGMLSPSKPPTSTTLPKSDNLVDDDDHQGETRKNAQIVDV